MRGRRRCATRARPKSPNSPASSRAASCSSNSCNGLPTASSGARRRAGREAGLAIGLYRDLAVGANPHGAEAWADNELVVAGASIGAPPDPLSRSGQNWGLAPLNPLALRRRGFAPLIAALRANMRHAGVLRIDHVMGLRRLYWIPSGSPATSGAYVEYPFEDVLRLLALESRRHGCAVIGEDLGTVPDGFRETMRAAERAVLPGSRVRAARRRQLHAARRLPAARRRLGRDPRSGDREGVLARARHRVAPPARRLSRRRRPKRPRPRSARRDRRLLLEALAREGLLARERFGALSVGLTASRSMTASWARRSSSIWRARGRG